MSKSHIIHSSRIFWSALLVLSAAGAAWVIYWTPWGIGISPDSISYIGGARGLLAGQGYSLPLGDDRYRELVTYMPAMSLLLAGVGVFGVDPLHSARFVQAGLFTINIALVGLLVRGSSGSTLAGLVAATLILISPNLVHIHTAAWSESLFIVFMLVGFGLLARHLDHQSNASLALAGIMLGLSYLARYAGLALIGAGILAIVLFHRGTWRQWIPYAVILTGIASFTVIGWAVRNHRLEIESPRRPLAWHPPSDKEWLHGLTTVRKWFVPDGSTTPAAWFVAEVAATLAGVAAWLAWGRAGSVAVPAVALRRSLGGIAGIAALTYVMFLIAAITLFDSGVQLDRRILAPAWVLVVVAALSFLGSSNGGLARVAGTAVVTGLIILLGFGSISQAQTARRAGIGYAAPHWINSQTIEAVKRIPGDRRIYTNGADVVLLFAQRGAAYVPAKWSAITDDANPHLEDQVVRMADDLRTRRAVIVLFRNITARSAFLTESELRLRFRLRRTATLDDGVIYEWDHRPSTTPATRPATTRVTQPQRAGTTTSLRR